MTVDLIEQKPEPVEPLAKTAVELNVPEPAHATQYEWDEKRLNRLRLEATGVLKTIEAAQNWDETDLPVEEEELDLVALAKARGVVANLESQTTDEEVAAHKARLAWRRRKEEAVGQERVELVSRDGRFYVFGREIKLDENQSFMGAMVKNGEVYVQFKQTDQVEIKRGAFRKSHYEERTRVLLVPVEELYIDSELEAELPTDDNVVAFPLSA